MSRGKRKSGYVCTKCGHRNPFTMKMALNRRTAIDHACVQCEAVHQILNFRLTSPES